MAPFDITAGIKAVCADMTQRLPELAHVDVRRVGFVYSRARSRSQYGIYATLTPLRFAGGASVSERRGRRFQIQRVVDATGLELLYVLSVYLPRFMELPLSEKLITLLHELWHINPDFNGDIRRHEGRCYAHSTSTKKFDEAMGVLAERWLAHDPPETLFSFLRYDWRELWREHGQVVGTRMKRPRMFPVPGST